MNVMNQQAALEEERAALGKELAALRGELAGLEAARRQRDAAGSGDHAPLPQVVASYAAYLHARAHATPGARVTSDHAELALTIGDTTLVLAFGCRGQQWSLHWAEVRHGERTTAFSRGRVADAVTALLRP